MGINPAVGKTTLLTSKFVELGEEAPVPKFHEYVVVGDPTIDPSKLKLFPVIHKESFDENETSKISFITRICVAVSMHEPEEPAIKVTK